ncbi:LysM peptidoglycan-binding domain-containing protein [Micromonospora sp. WMMC250]|uniref:LysM peptidoglycan-binding domain-containing protein n=1 Tax=Micromonospora sp. WMMC250 TaxID=3014781 RepID=UPI0022B6FF6E|nr:LysM peptidoglycan-binding domain-containing protein [Micromonospora sp. WMMC250]MCZ7373937.1 LysM peptidoglycan-binding domain-containing protein [Micromonospora sp. WMMC250]
MLAGQGIGAWPTCGKKGGSSGGSATKSTAKPTKSTGKPTKSTAKPTERPSRGEQPATRNHERTASPAGGQAYLVQPGDTLSEIADAHRVSGGWQALYEHNRKLIGADPGLIFPGQKLSL